MKDVTAGKPRAWLSSKLARVANVAERVLVDPVKVATLCSACFVQTGHAFALLGDTHARVPAASVYFLAERKSQFLLVILSLLSFFVRRVNYHHRFYLDLLCWNRL